jgi:hypothetical protein
MRWEVESASRNKCDHRRNYSHQPEPRFVRTVHQGRGTRANRIGCARTFEDEATALRWLGLIKLRARTASSITEGNELVARAWNVEQKYGPIVSADVAALVKAGVQLDWSEGLAPIDCDQARTHFAKGVSILNAAGANRDLDGLRRAAIEKLGTGIGGIGSCKPDAGPSLR